MLTIPIGSVRRARSLKHSPNKKTSADGISTEAPTVNSIFLRKSLSLKRPGGHSTLEHLTAAPKTLGKIFARHRTSASQENHQGPALSIAPVINMPSLEPESEQRRHGKIVLHKCLDPERDECEGTSAMDYLLNPCPNNSSPASTLSRCSDPYTVQVVKLSTPTELVFDSLSCANSESLDDLPSQDFPTSVDEDLDETTATLSGILYRTPSHTPRNSLSNFDGMEAESRIVQPSAFLHITFSVSDLSLSRARAQPKRYPDDISDDEATSNKRDSVSLFKKRRALGVSTTTGTIPKMRSCSVLPQSDGRESRLETHRLANTPSIGSLTLAVSCTHLEAENEMASRAGALLMANRIRL